MQISSSCNRTSDADAGEATGGVLWAAGRDCGVGTFCTVLAEGEDATEAERDGAT